MPVAGINAAVVRSARAAKPLATGLHEYDRLVGRRRNVSLCNLRPCHQQGRGDVRPTEFRSGPGIGLWQALCFLLSAATHIQPHARHRSGSEHQHRWLGDSSSVHGKCLEVKAEIVVECILFKQEADPRDFRELLRSERSSPLVEPQITASGSAGSGKCRRRIVGCPVAIAARAEALVPAGPCEMIVAG